MKDSMRLDILLFERGFFSSREQARAAIMAGEVLVNEVKAEKSGMPCSPQAQIRLLGQRLPYVSRGGLKLRRAIEVFELDFTAKTVIDIGASTGGFTDCALQAGAAKVYAVDVGYGQLAWKLRQDERVFVLEKTNARYLNNNLIPEQADIITADVSFISLTLALPQAIEKLLKTGGEVVALVKPQFEAGRSQVGKRGVVRDKSVHEQVLARIINSCRLWKLGVAALTYSLVAGPKGNIEYLLYALKNAEPRFIDIGAVVNDAWAELAESV